MRLPRYALPLLAVAAPLAAQPDPAGGVPDPPPPQVRIQVRTPSAVAPGKPIPYKLLVSNPAAERAYKVKVRNPVPDGVTVGKCDPVHTGPPGGKELVWDVGELPAGGQKVIEFELTPATGTRQVRNQAFVTSEYGQAVLTKVEEPKLKVEKAVTKSATAGEPVPVEVRVTNTGTVRVGNVVVREQVTDGFRYDGRDDGRKGLQAEQRLWEVGALAPGQSRTLRYAVSGDKPRLVTTTIVTADGVAGEVKKETDTEVLTTGLAVDLSAPPTVPGGQRGKFTVVARNTGTAPLADVRLTAGLPPGVALKKMTNGGQRDRDAVEWTLRRLDPGETYEVRFEVDSATTGKKTVRAAARAGRGVEAKPAEASTLFEGTTLLSLRADAEPALPQVGQQGTLTIIVSNGGTEPARDAKLRVELPDGVQLVGTTPREAQTNKAGVWFPATTVAPSDPRRYTLTFRADKPGVLYFKTTLESPGLGDRPLVKEQSVDVQERRGS